MVIQSLPMLHFVELCCALLAVLPCALLRYAEVGLIQRQNITVTSQMTAVASASVEGSPYSGVDGSKRQLHCSQTCFTSGLSVLKAACSYDLLQPCYPEDLVNAAFYSLVNRFHLSKSVTTLQDPQFSQGCQSADPTKLQWFLDNRHAVSDRMVPDQQSDPVCSYQSRLRSHYSRHHHAIRQEKVYHNKTLMRIDL